MVVVIVLIHSLSLLTQSFHPRSSPFHHQSIVPISGSRTYLLWAPRSISLYSGLQRYPSPKEKVGGLGEAGFLRRVPNGELAPSR